MTPSTEAINLGLQRLDKARESYLAGEAKSTEAILDAARAILAAGVQNQNTSLIVSSADHEKPSDFLQRVMWAEVRDTNTGTQTHELVDIRLFEPADTFADSLFCRHYWSSPSGLDCFKNCAMLAPPA